MLDTGNTTNVYNHCGWFLNLKKLDKKIEFLCANGNTSSVEFGGQAWAKLQDVNGKWIFHNFGESVLNTEYPANLKCVASMLKDKQGNKTPHDVDFKNDVVIYHKRKVNETRVPIYTQNGLPTMKIFQLNDQDRIKLRMHLNSKPGKQSSMYSHLRKLT